MLPIKLGNDPRRSGEAQSRAPTSCVNYTNAKRFVRPRVIEIEMKAGRGYMHTRSLIAIYLKSGAAAPNSKTQA